MARIMPGPARLATPITALGLLVSMAGCPGSDDVATFGDGGSGGSGVATGVNMASGSQGTGADSADGTAGGGGGGDSSASGDGSDDATDDASGDASSDAGCMDEPEVCNGEDDNCDGDVDEGLDEEVVCGVGICEVITSTCIDGEPVECVAGDPNPEGETCDGTDDDCAWKRVGKLEKFGKVSHG